jgi:tRNA nucleotidyltransferase (CCA-adding enzyme)
MRADSTGEKYSPMTEPYIGHSEIAAFAEEKVNLSRDDVKEYREQVNRLREKLAEHIASTPGYALVKMLHSGSVAKGTALRTLNDMDVAVYVKKDEAPSLEEELLRWLAERLREAYPNLSSDQIEPSTHCVRVSFRGSGLDVDVAAVLYEGDPDDRGYLITSDTGDRVLTSIPLHLQFTRRRKDKWPTDFAQVVRLAKWWAKEQKARDANFKFKSFMSELLVAHLAESGISMADYSRAVEEFFAYIVSTGLSKRVYFTDHYGAGELPETQTQPIEVFDPVNPANNVATRYSESDRLVIVAAANDAFDAITEAHYATTKERAVGLWQSVFGASFRA